MSKSPEIWDKIYQDGNFMQYPSEYFVKLIKDTEATSELNGVTLDYGCGSGNNAESLLRAGHQIACAEVSQTALDVTKHRLKGIGGEDSSYHLINPLEPLSPQLPKYDNVVCWLALCYATEIDMAFTIKTLIDGMSQGGFFWFATSTKNDLLFRLSLPGLSATRILGPKAGAQEGAVMTIFDGHQELESMFAGAKINDIGSYGMTFNGTQHEYLVIRAQKLPQHE